MPMRFKVELMTPEAAGKLLTRTEELGYTNRSLRKRKVEKFAHAITAGQWQATHQAVAVSPDGGVLDGQHRLAAVVASGQAVEMTVARNAPPESFGVIDNGTARTAADALKIEGYTDTNILSAMVRGFLGYRAVVGTTESFQIAHELTTTSDVIEFLDDKRQQEATLAALTTARRVAGQLARHGLTSSIGISEMLVRLLPNEVGVTTAAEFYLRLGDGVMLGPQSPILAARRWFTGDSGYERVENKLRRPTAIGVLTKALNDYALGEERHIIRFRPGTDPYPVPLVKGTRRKREAEMIAHEEALAAEGR